ncbi:MAG: hypothetical protein GIX02_00565 [Candidatus Eremiobacteraeota bacterium]|nr:hypothetical protein [Candidatus Eremiobacteraeota bacterium]
MNPLFRFFHSLNTHRVGIAGLLTAAVGFLADPTVKVIVGTLPQDTQDKVQAVGAAVGAAGTLLAYFGRPKTIAQTPGDLKPQ